MHNDLCHTENSLNADELFFGVQGFVSSTLLLWCGFSAILPRVALFFVRAVRISQRLTGSQELQYNARLSALRR
jgi:hypothetical protein